MRTPVFFLLVGGAFALQAQLPANVPATGLVGYWPFTGNANDLSVNVNHGIVNGATLTADRYGISNRAYSFDGINDYINVPDDPTLSNFNGMTISAWFNLSTFQASNFDGVQCILAKWYHVLNCGNNTDTYECSIAGNKAQFATNNNNISGFPNPPALTASDLNTWKHVVYITDPQLGQMIYINGVQSGTSSATGAICASTNDLLFGADQHISLGLERFFNGKLDDIGIWNRVLSASEINSLYTGTVSSVGLQANRGNAEPLIFPNPSRGVFHLSNLDPSSTIVVCDVLGQVLRVLSVQSSQTEVDLSDHPDGVYLLTVRSDHRTQNYRIVKSGN